MRRLDLRRNSVLGLLAWAMACKAETNDPAPVQGATESDTSPITGGTGGSTGTGAGTGADTTAADTTAGANANCGDVVCSGHGSCEIGENDQPYCACDAGYKPDESGEECIVDESCVQLRILEDHCRQAEIDGPPAVSLFFAVDFCAGTAVLPDKFQDLGLQFQVLENGVDIQENVESYSTVIPKPVESYVDLVIDVSDSITSSEDLPALITELRTLVASLEPGVGAPDVYVAIHAFARQSVEYVPFTRDLAAVDAALAAIVEDPAAVVQLAGNGMGTDLYNAIELGIHRTQRIRDLREAVTWGGVLSTGTVVVVTDGKDTSGGMLESSLVSDTTNNIISIGISADIDDETLREFGRDGSFLAPAPSDWPGAFAEIAQRVKEYPDRSYFLAYCSSATEGSPTVEISIAGAGITVEKTTGCTFEADLFSVDPLDVCNGAYFADECDTQACGGLTACGACSDGECCNGSACQGPAAATPFVLNDCAEQNDVCAPDGLVCSPDGVCAPPELPGTGTCGDGCAPGVTRCVEEQCVPVLETGDECEVATDCPELNCRSANPDNPLVAPTCQPTGALLYDDCGSDAAVCEDGGYCSSVCLPRKREAESCGGSRECRSADCVMTEGAGSRCGSPGFCFWSWDEKVPT